MRFLICLLSCWAIFSSSTALGQETAKPAESENRLSVLFLGDNGHHQPPQRFAQLAPRLASRGIQLTYTDSMSDLNAETLGKYDGLIVYANQDTIEPDQATALLTYVREGGGFVPLHCASYCFRNSPEYVELVGGQFQRHGGEVFGTEIAEPDHPVMQGFGGFRSWDETYIHILENPDREILEYRVEGDQAAGRDREPYTWVRTFGEGRVFYTAWGHDHRTFGNPGFINLVERGVRWACGGDPSLAGPFQQRDPFVMPEMTEIAADAAPFEYDTISGNKIPNYLAGENWGTQGKPLTRMQKPLSPADSLQHYVTPRDFSVALYASEENMGAKPIAMNWDERGRLWVCLTIDYPNELRRPGQGNDRIVICEDTDGDQVADKFTQFADQLSIPTALVHYRGGAIVQDGTRTLYLKDTDGDDVADIRQMLITGWQLGDTHGGVSNFRYGLDNWIWAMQGYNDSTPKFAGGTAGPFRMGFFRFKLDANDPPNVTDLEFIRSSNNNTWGLGISEEGLIFGSTANRHPSLFMPIANRYYERVRGWGPEQLSSISDDHLFEPITENVRQVDHHGGYTAGAGHSLYTARRYPQTWWNRIAVVNGPTGHLAGIFELTPSGAGFTSQSPGNLIASDDEWSAPILTEVGPDGNYWVLDWYNYIVQHNPTPQGFETGRGNAYESDLRDKIHGRIVRVTHGDDSDIAFPQLSTENPQTVVTTLAHPNMLWRLHAQRLLVERGQLDVVDALVATLGDRSVDAIGLNAGVIHALWTLDGLGAIAQGSATESAVAALLDHPSAGVRRAAIQVLPKTAENAERFLAGGLLADDDAQVQLAAILALADTGEVASVVVAEIAQLAADPTIQADRWLQDAVTSAAAVHASSFLAAYVRQAGPASDPQSTLVRRVAEHVARGRPGQELTELFASLGGADAARIAPILAGLNQGWPADHKVPAADSLEGSLLQLAEQLPPAELSQLVSLSNRLGSNVLANYAERVAEEIMTVLDDSEATDPRRIAAAQQLLGLLPESPQVVESILQTIDLQMAPRTAAAMIQSLSASRSEKMAEYVVDSLADWTPAVRETAIRLLLSRPEWTSALIAGLQANQLAMSDLALDQRQALARHPQADIRAAATELMKAGGGLPSPNRVAVIERYHDAVTLNGDVDRGREMFKQHCSKCHRHGDMGVEIGPELTGMAVHPREELLVHILDPSRSVEGNFRSYTVLTLEGRVLTGMLAGESRTTIELIDTNGKRETLPRADIEELAASTKSVMPEGFEDQLNVAQMTDLLEFLTARGKYLPLDLRAAATLPSDRPMFYGAEGEVMLLDDWGPRQVEGVPFSIIKPNNGRVANLVMLYGPNGQIPPELPKSVEFPVNSTAKAIHMLGGVGGWNAKAAIANGPAVMTVRLWYADGSKEDHVLRDGVHFADYIGPFDVPGSKPAFKLRRGFQMRYLKLEPAKPDQLIEKIQLLKNNHTSTPITMAITLEG
ncbi:PVC-type heme-binding CxxCH protein [Planctomycetaceae bacterium SH139]